MKPGAVDMTLRRVEQLSALGVAVASLENLTSMRTFDRGELLSWQVARTRFHWMTGRPGKALEILFSKAGLRVLFSGRLVAAAALLAGEPRPSVRRGATAFLTGSSYALRARTPYGSDGSEVLLGLTLTSLTLADLFRDDPRARNACVWFITAQSCLSYGIAGTAKLVSPVWRDGSALPDIFRTKIFGQREVFRTLRGRPRTARALGWVTIAGETLFPLVLIVPKPLAKALLAVGAGFHGGNAVAMGLNRFVWAFIGTYPAIVHCARRLGEQRQAGRRP